MKSARMSCLGLILGVGLSATAAVTAPPVPGGFPVGVGFNMHVAGSEQDWDAIKAAGATLVRKDFAWTAIEKTKGVYDFSGYDAALKAMDARGIRGLFILDYGNPLYGHPQTTDDGREAYAKWAAAAAAHYKGRHILWEIWNEPNVGFWGKSPMNSAEFAQQYVALVKATVPAMRAADPQCCILAGSVSCLWKDSFRWIDAAFQDGLLETGINALSVHPYGFGRPEWCADPVQLGNIKDQGYAVLRAKLAAAGAKDFPVVDTEVGYGADKKATPQLQAMLFVRLCLLDQMCHMHFTTWYNWDENDAASCRVRSKPGEAPLPVYKACQNMTAEMAGYHFVERLKVGSDMDYVLAFENGAQGRKLVAWAFDVPAKKGPKPLKDPQGKPAVEAAVAPLVHELGIPIAGARGPVAVRDLYGKPVAVQPEAGTVTLTLSASPQYIDLSGQPAPKPVEVPAAAKPATQP